MPASAANKCVSTQQIKIVKLINGDDIVTVMPTGDAQLPDKSILIRLEKPLQIKYVPQITPKGFRDYIALIRWTNYTNDSIVTIPKDKILTITNASPEMAVSYSHIANNYNKLDNPDLDDIYHKPRWDNATGKWVIEQILKDQENMGQAEAKRRKSYVETYYSQYDFGTEVNAKIDSYLVGITSYINANPPYKSWKYTTQPIPPDIPKIHADIMKAFKNLPLPHSFAYGGGPTLTFPGETQEG